MSEHWFGAQSYCPNCGESAFHQYENNRPVADFICQICGEEFELKSQKGAFATKIADGAYSSMMKRLKSKNNPNLMLLGYHPTSLSVTNLVVVPKHFFTPEIIERRNFLAPPARRSGWTGCNILIRDIPLAGKIFLVRNGITVPPAEVKEKWNRNLFLRQKLDLNNKGWLLSVMRCIETLDRTTFSIADMYEFEEILRSRYPNNRYIKEKIRQQLQILRDEGFLEFSGKGIYRLPIRASYPTGA